MNLDPKGIKNLLQGLGKSTKRGIKKCSKCGTYNGTRGVFCKNFVCDALLKHEEGKLKSLIKACKLVTDDATQIYSVRVNDQSADQRGFVQLPLNSSSLGLCFIDDCPKTFNTDILKCHEKKSIIEIKRTSNLCQHIESAKHCVTTATPLSLNLTSVVDSMNLLPSIKAGLWDLLPDPSSANEPVVQRISHSIFVVKCKTSSKHPLGYLHLTIYNNVKHRDKPDYRHYCPCPVEYKDLSSYGSDINEKKCVHYYALICSFASDQTLSQEFSHFIQSEQILTLFVNQYLPNEEDGDQLVAIFDSVHPEILAAADSDLGTVELITSSETNSLSDINNVYTYLTIEQPNGIQLDSNITDKPITQNKKTTNSNNIEEYKTKKRKTTSKQNKATGNVKQSRKMIKYDSGKKLPAKLSETITNNLEREEKESLSFLRWLGSISERIYQEMHFQFDGNEPKSLIFPTPMNFFGCLRERIATLGPRRRLPNSTIAFVSTTPPVGVFTKFIWQLTSVIHVKQVFDNPFVPLKLTRNFVANSDGTFTPTESPKLDDQEANVNYPKIKPLSLSTYLKVGKTSANQFEPTPFIIEFIPDLLPITKMGEMKITFQFGRLTPAANR